MRPLRASLALGVCAAAMMAAGCAARPALSAPSAPLRSASLQQLVASYNHNADAVRSMSLKLVLNASAGKKKYLGVNGYLLTQKPSNLRIWGTFTLVGKIFDMASDGTDFELLLPTRNQFFEGENDVIPSHAKNPLEDMRPQVILNALLIDPVTAAQRTALDPSQDGNVYSVLVLQPGADASAPGVDRLVRKISFSRYDLLPHAQEIFDADGIHSTRATYAKYTVRDGVPIPTDITISRPIEDYSLRLRLNAKGIVLNQSFPGPNPFVLAPPAGATVIRLGPDGNPPPTEKMRRRPLG